jgi:alpha-glucosidase
MIMRFLAIVSAALLTLVVYLVPTPATAAPQNINVLSPDGKVSARVSSESGDLRYSILFDGKEVLAPSRLGIRADGIEWGEGVSFSAVHSRQINETYRQWGAQALARSHARRTTVTVTSHAQRYWVDVHVANDGVGVRLRLAAKRGRKVEADRSSWVLPGDPTVWADQLDPSYESSYRTANLRELGGNSLGIPITARLGTTYVAIAEAGLNDYGDLGLRVGEAGALNGYLYADPNGWVANDSVVQPWRVTIVARNLTDLVNTTLVQNLNPAAASALANARWIKPGRASWQWMAIGAPKQDVQAQWVDWTQQLGYEYYLVDEGWEKWRDPWTTLANLSTYAKSKKVKLWLWVHSKQVHDRDARRAYFRQAVAAGVVGVKIDFPEPANRAWSTWYHDVARDAANAKLMVNFHGAVKPTGMERTWPNVLTREAVRGHEWHMTRYNRVQEPAHDTILPFTRYLVGPGDYTPTVFEAKELIGNTWAHEVAQAIVFTSPFLSFGGHPRDFVANPARDILMALPATWDETRILPGSEPGKIVAEARRKGSEWFVAVMNGGDATRLTLSLDFIGSGRWQSSQLFDAKGRSDAWHREDIEVTRTGSIALDLAPRGGFVGWIRRPST